MTRSAKASRYNEGGRVRYDRRARGMLLRLVRRRRLALLIGIALAAPAAWLEIALRYNAWWIDGLALILGATGVALIWTAIVGAKADWIDPNG